jgi:ferrous iron transport protein B
MRLFSTLKNDPIKFLLVGNPNTGKTTLFNSLTKSNEHVGNWHGVTVSEKEKIFYIEKKPAILSDLPGLYSLTTLSYEEEVASEYIFKNLNCQIINICDINNLKRNLFLTLQLAEITNKLILFINTFKNSEKIKEEIKNCEKILNKLGINYFIGNANNKKEINQFKKILNNKFVKENNFNKLKNNYLDIEKITFIKSIIFENCFKINYDPFAVAIRLLENDENIENKLNLDNQKKEIIKEIIKKNNFIELNEKRFEYINNLFENINNKNKKIYGSSKLDKILLNKYLALPIFFGILFLIFYLTFFSLGATLSNFLRDFIQNVAGDQITTWLRGVCNVAWVVDLVETGFIGGVGSILAFLPQVVLLFLFLSLIEDSGYLARIAFLFEDVFAKVGLSGKSVYALLMSFGCSTTAALTARNMEDKNAKIKTALLTPYMSCSAKLPIYAVIGGAFFGVTNIFIIFGLYIIGIIVALFLSLLLEQKLLKSKEQSFILEFPAYRLPSVERVLKILWENLKLFLIRIGTIIFALNIIIWILQSFSFSFKFVPTSPGAISMLQHIGSLIAPIFIPLGFGNWGASAALIAGLAAKEIIVSSIAMFNGINVFGDSMKSQTMRSILDPSAVVFFTPSGALSFMIFCLLYSPCLPTISVFRKEIGKKWTFLAIIIQFAIAYSLSLILFNLYRLVEIWGGLNVLLCFIAVFIIVFSIIYLIDKIKHRKLCNYNCNKCNRCK